MLLRWLNIGEITLVVAGEAQAGGRGGARRVVDYGGGHTNPPPRAHLSANVPHELSACVAVVCVRAGEITEMNL